MVMPETIGTRQQLLNEVRQALIQRFDEHRQDVEAAGPWDGVPVLTAKDLDETLAAVFGEPIPPPSETTVEVRTPAMVMVSALCPRCSLPALIPVSIDPELRIDSSGSELRVKAKAKARLHVCGQLSIDDHPADGQEAFALDDIVRPEDAVETCPFPGCTLDADHAGVHNDPESGVPDEPV